MFSTGVGTENLYMDDEQEITENRWQTTEASEVARLFFGHPYMVGSLGTLLPPSLPLEEIQFVLDIGCGTGEWACRLAKAHPHIRVIGIDTSARLIREAVKRVLSEGLSSVSFIQFDSAQPLDFRDNLCDVVHVHSLASFITTAMWSTILDEMIRVLKPGGWLNIVDYEQGSTSSHAFNELHILGMKGVTALGGSIAPSSSPTLGVATRLYGFLVDAGMIDVSYSVHAVDYGINRSAEALHFIDDLITGMINFRPYILGLNLTDGEAFDALIKQASKELHDSRACGYSYLVSALGRKDYY
jgi:precorrin-6B methylase 2